MQLAKSSGCIVIALGAVASCSTVQPDSRDNTARGRSHFETDRLVYTLSAAEPGDTVIVTYTNPHANAVYFRVCGEKNPNENDPLPAIGTKPVSDVVVSETGAREDLGFQWACLYAPRRVIAPGAVMVDTVPIFRATAPGALWGKYRVVYWVYDRPSQSELDEDGLLPLTHRTTNAFTIRISRSRL